MQQNPPEPLNVAADDEMCFGVGRTVEDAFIAGLTGNSPVQDLPNIGPHIRQQLNNANIQTVNDFLQAAIVVGTSAARMARFVAGLVPNARPNQCTPSRFTRPGVYQVAFVNVCGYNTLIRLVQFAHNHQNDFAMYGLANAFNFNFAPQLQLRHRGTNNGSRHCACRNTQDACTGAAHIDEHQGHCRWVVNQQRCVPRGGGGETAGYLGRYLGPNTFQRDKQKDRNVTGLRRTQGWRHPNAAAQPPAAPQQQPPPQPPQPPNAQLPAPQLPQLPQQQQLQQNVLGGGTRVSSRAVGRRVQNAHVTTITQRPLLANTKTKSTKTQSATKSNKPRRIVASKSKRATASTAPPQKKPALQKAKPKSKTKSRTTKTTSKTKSRTTKTTSKTTQRQRHGQRKPNQS
jgi:hypothetical protein